MHTCFVSFAGHGLKRAGLGLALGLEGAGLGLEGAGLDYNTGLYKS